MTNKEIKIYKDQFDLNKLNKEIWNAMGGSKLLKEGENKKKPSPQNEVSKTSKMGKGRDYMNNKKVVDYQEYLNPFTPALKKVKPSVSESKKLQHFVSKIVKAKNMRELNEIINQAMNLGMRTNACNEGEWSLAESVILSEVFNQGKESEQKHIMRELMLKGAVFSDQSLEYNNQIKEMHGKLEKEVHAQLIDQSRKLREVAENASIEGSVKSVEFDNQSFYVEFGEGTMVSIGKMMDGAKKLGFNQGEIRLESNIVKIGSKEVEFKIEKGGERNYIDLSDESAFDVIFDTNLGKVNITVYQKGKDPENIGVKVADEDKEKWDKLKKAGEVVGKGCLFGGMTVREAVEKGSFTRCGKLRGKIEEIMCGNLISTEEIKQKEPEKWVDKIDKGGKVNSIS